jgi:hypothetical protein
VLPTTPGEQSCSGSISAADGTPAPLSSPPPPPAALAASAALGTASRLADLASRGLPLDADAIAAGIVADAAADGRLSVADAAARLGPGPAALLQDVLALRSLPRKADCYDDEAAAQLREEALALYDGRAAMVEVARRAAAMSMGNQNNGDRNGNSDSAPAPPSSFSASSTLVSPAAARQIAALESLQLYGPLGHALGMGPVAAELEDACFQELFPSSYAETATWLRREAGAYRSALGAAAERLQRALDDHDARSGGELDRLAARLEVVVRTKSLFSTMKKLLRLDDLSAGGRERVALFDLLGMRVVVHPKDEGEGGGGGGRGRGAAAEAEEAEEGGEVEEAEGEEEETIVVFSSGGAAAAASFPPRSAESAATEPLPLPRPSSPSQAERDAIAACYLVRDVASALWPPVPGRSKDYIARPKPNGYASLHLTVRPFGGAEAAVVDLRGGGKDDSIGGGEEEDGSDGSGFETGSGYVTDGSVEASSASEEGPALELQIRTARMHASAEFGEVRLKVFPFFFLSGGGAEVLRGKPPKGSKKKLTLSRPLSFFVFFHKQAAHTAYKGGLARERAAALAAWTAAAAASAASDWSGSSSEDDDDGEAAASLPLLPLSSSSSSSVSLLPSSSVSFSSSSSSPPSSPPWTKRRQAAAALFAHLDANGDGKVSVEELAAALRDMSFSDDASSSEELRSVARRLMATAKKGASWLCSEEEIEEEDSLSLDAFLEMMNQVRVEFFFAFLLFCFFFHHLRQQKLKGDDETSPSGE